MRFDWLENSRMIPLGKINNFLRLYILGLALLLCGGLLAGCGDDSDPVAVEKENPFLINLTRLNWSWASVPIHGQSEEYVAQTGDGRDFKANDRVETIRWFLPREVVFARYLDPDLISEARDEPVQTMDMFLRADDGQWNAGDWGGIMTGRVSPDLVVSSLGFLDVWINDGIIDRDLRSGTLHFDLGAIDEDGFWPVDSDGNLDTGTWQREDGILYGVPDGVFDSNEDIGLDGNEFGPQKFDAAYEVNGDLPYPGINGTARNNREDSEDLNGNGRFDRLNSFLTGKIDLKETEPLIDVVYDFDDVYDLIDNKIAWRRYRIPLGSLLYIRDNKTGDYQIYFRNIRIWFEDGTTHAKDKVHLQIARLRFVDCQ